jgi:arsenical pump membrane protein
LSSPLALLVVLPPLALALEAFGWRDRIADRLARIRRPMPRLLATYAAWLATSAALTLDVAAIAAASVGIAVAGARREEGRWQLGGAILGANVGSLLLPFSNLTNMVLVSASGIGFAAYVGIAIWPQIAAALAVGILFALRARRAVLEPTAPPVVEEARSRLRASTTAVPEATARLAGAMALLGGISAVAVGLAGGDMAVPFAVSAAALVGTALATGRLAIRTVARSVPLAGVAVIAIAAIARDPMGVVAARLPQPDVTSGGIVLVVAVGCLVATLANNLPAAAFGAVWLARVHPATLVAFLIGTNIGALATPHGSVATILARAVGRRHGVEIPARAYLGSAWRYALVGSLAGTLALVVVARQT